MAKGYRGGSGAMGGFNNANMIKQAQKMQQDMMRIQGEIETQEFEAGAGGGVVKAKVNGKRELLELSIDPQAVDADDIEMLQDMIIAAVNEALRNAEQTMEQAMSKFSAGLGGLF